MMYNIFYSTKLKRDIKRIKKGGYDLNLFKTVVDLLASGSPMPAKYKDHALIGNWSGFRECHIAPDWLLIYKIDVDLLILTLTRTGSHNELF